MNVNFMLININKWSKWLLKIPKMSNFSISFFFKYLKWNESHITWAVSRLFEMTGHRFIFKYCICKESHITWAVSQLVKMTGHSFFFKYLKWKESHITWAVYRLVEMTGYSFLFLLLIFIGITLTFICKILVLTTEKVLQLHLTHGQWVRCSCDTF